MAGLFKKPLDMKLQSFIADLCKAHGFDRSDFLQMGEDIATGRYMFAFKARVFDPELVTLAKAIRDRVGDHFVGEVTRAAAPELSKDAGELADLIINPQVRIVTVEAEVLHNFRP